jgi:hypothetical protein
MEYSTALYYNGLCNVNQLISNSNLKFQVEVTLQKLQ